MLRDAFHLLKISLELLDGAAAPAHIGAYVDLAAHQLAESLGSLASDTPNPVEQIAARH